MSGASTGRSMAVGVPLAGPNPAGSTARPPGAAQHPHHDPTACSQLHVRYTRPGRPGEAPQRRSSGPRGSAATAAATAAAAAATPGTRVVVLRPAARTVAHTEVPVATRRGTHSVRGARDGLRMARKGRMFEAWRRLRTCSRRPKSRPPPPLGGRRRRAARPTRISTAGRSQSMRVAGSREHASCASC